MALVFASGLGAKLTEDALFSGPEKRRGIRHPLPALFCDQLLGAVSEKVSCPLAWP